MPLTLTLPERTQQLARNRERWAEVLADPNLSESSYRIETNAFGQIVMSPPPAIPHGSRQSLIPEMMRSRLGGHTATECPVSTADGVKGIDVAWFSESRFEMVRDQIAAETAPEICMEIRSPRNTDAEMRTKRALYFDAGAIECWECDLNGQTTYYLQHDADTPHQQSKLCPTFPNKIEY